jgi:bacteriorhodopsin
MPFVWIFVWGPRLQRVVRQKRLSRLLWVGLLVSALAFLGASAVSPYTMFTSPLPDYVPLWGVRLFAFLAWLGMGAANLGAALRMFEAAIRKWGTWREESTAEETAPD